MDVDPVATLLSRLANVRRLNAGGHTARCPAHEDQHNSLKIDTGLDGQALVFCHAGCPTESVVDAVGMTMADLFPAREPTPIRRNGSGPRLVRTVRYTIPSAIDDRVAIHVRKEFSDGTKDMPWETPEGRSGLGGLRTTDLRLYGIADLGDAAEVVMVEGEKARDAGQELGVACVGTVTGASGTPSDASLRPLIGRLIFLWADNDDPGRSHMERIAKRLVALGQPPQRIRRILWKKAPDKGDVVDWITVGGNAAVLRKKLDTAPSWNDDSPPTYGIDEVIQTYRKWLSLPGDDAGPVYVVLGAVAANLLDADPVWLLIVGSSSGGKTEIINPLAGLLYVHVAATLTEASLLSGTPKRDKAAGSKGGLLREIGDFGILALKDFTSILSMNRDQRAALLAALREIFDGSWTRHIGVDGGRTLSWTGKLGVIGGCTASIDSHHTVMAVMGERFVLYRLPEIDPEKQAERAIANVGHEREMRAELTAAVRGLFAGLDVSESLPSLDAGEITRLVALASLVASARSAVERDSYKREIDLILDTEGPARLAQTLRRLYAGMLAIGLDRDMAWALICKTGFDCIPKLRRAAFNVLVSADDWLTTTEIATTAGYPSITARRALEDMAAHGVVSVHAGGAGKATRWKLSNIARKRLETTLSDMSVKGIEYSSSLFKNPHRVYDDKTDKVFQEGSNSAQPCEELGYEQPILARPDWIDKMPGIDDDECYGNEYAQKPIHCWSCKQTVADDADRCPACEWRICACGACSRECELGQSLVRGSS